MVPFHVNAAESLVQNGNGAGSAASSKVTSLGVVSAQPREASGAPGGDAILRSCGLMIRLHDRDSVPLATFGERRRKPEDRCGTLTTERSEGGYVPTGDEPTLDGERLNEH